MLLMNELADEEVEEAKKLLVIFIMRKNQSKIIITGKKWKP
uniref:Uncharacterized protein n=1 Tax=Candidatus Kentrum sp. FW TaxID=2126338 RepID=A0A450T3F5_9GAMM|nr:MAG: hypothetical protein BECKFW1821B_GA0114236_106012 [Candidatus Kentron sp. FW]